MRLEDAVEHERGEELLRLLVDDHVVLGPDVLAPAEEVRDRPAVVVERRLERPATTPDVAEEGDTALLEHGPHRVVVGVRGRHAPARVRGEQDGARAHVEGFDHRRQGRLGTGPERLGDRDEAWIVGAEVDHRAVVRTEPAQHHLGLLAQELGGRERREHQLAVEAEQVQRSAPFGRIEGTEGAPTLGRQEVRLCVASPRRVVPACRRVAHGPLGHAAGPAEVERTQPFSHPRIGVGLQPVRELHQMAVRVVARSRHVRLGLGGAHDVPPRVAPRVPISRGPRWPRSRRGCPAHRACRPR